MKRFFKRFAAHSDYETFKSSAEYIMPNISVCDDDKLNVHYNPIPPLINFNIDDESYQALEGMTWDNWINSQYNINNKFRIYYAGPSPLIVLTSNTSYEIYNNDVTVSIKNSDIIINNYNYTLYNPPGTQEPDIPPIKPTPDK